MRPMMIAVFAIVACAACAREATGSAASTAESESAAAVLETTVSPAEASSSPFGGSWDEKLSEQVGETVTLQGAFRGGQDRDCKFAPGTSPQGHSAPDWALEKGRRCVFVANGMRVFGDPELIVRRESLGRKVEITAIVKTRADGLIYLDYVSGKPLSD